MYTPTVQSIITAGLALIGILTKPSAVAKGKILDFAIEKCIDGDGNQRCSPPFFVIKSTCYKIEWTEDNTFLTRNC